MLCYISWAMNEFMRKITSPTEFMISISFANPAVEIGLIAHEGLSEVVNALRVIETILQNLEMPGGVRSLCE